MASRISPYVDNTGLVFAYDLANVNRSYLGQPTVNLHPNPEDVSSWTGNLFNNWISSAVTSNASIAPDGTLTADRLGDGYGRFNASVSITAGQTYTYSVYLKNVNLTNGFGIVYAWGLNGTLVSYGTAYNVSIAEISTGEWTRVTTTITAPGSGVNQVQFGPCPFTGYGNPSGQQLDVWGGHIENKSHATPYVNGTRSVTQGLKDLTGRSTIDLTNVSFDSNAQMTFDGTNDLITLADAAHLKFSDGSFTVEQVLNISSISGKQRTFSKGSSGWSRGWHAAARPTQWEFELSDGVSSPGNSFLINTATTVGTNHVVWVIESAATAKLYVNGAQVGSTQTITESVDFATTTSTVGIGAFELGGEYFNGRIPYTRLYARALTASEIQQNFNAIKGRYGL